jgi:hypothetical protein
VRRDGRPAHADSGASLILCIGFVLMIGAICAGLVGLATSGLNNRTTLQRVRDRQYAADGAIEQAIALVRPLSCSASNAFIVDASLNGVAIRVDWVNACGVVQSSSDGTVVAQRNVVFSACESTGAACSAANVIIRAEVNFQQAGTGGVTKTYVQSWSVNQ